MSLQGFTSFDALLEVLHDDAEPIPAAAIYRLSELLPDDLAALTEAWPSLPVGRRRTLLSRFNEISEANFEMDFSVVAELALDDEDEEVRCLAIACLWEVETLPLMHRLMDILASDPSAAAREAAASALGRFVLLGELGKLPQELVRPVEELLLQAYRAGGELLDVRRRALESLAYSGREEASDLIEEAYRHQMPRMRASAVFAMGRSADGRWASYVLQELESDEPAIRYEAAHAAGELELDEAVPGLIDLLGSDDVELRSAAIWSLGEIGGPQARRALSEAAQLGENEDLLDAIDDALSMAALVEGALGLIELPSAEPPGSEEAR